MYFICKQYIIIAQRSRPPLLPLVLAGYSSAAGAETTVCEACKVFYQTSLSRGSAAECRCHDRSSSSSSLHAAAGGGESLPAMIQPGEALLDCDACRLVVCQRVFRSVDGVVWVDPGPSFCCNISWFHLCYIYDFLMIVLRSSGRRIRLIVLNSH